MSNPFQKDFWHLENLRATWEYKAVAFILRMIVACAVIFYLILTVPNVWPWMQVTYARSQPADHFKDLLQTAIKTNDFEWAYLWLSARPKDETPQHAAIIEENAPQIPPMFLYSLAHAGKQAGDIAQQRFWLTYTQYRMRFDLIRCGQDGLIARYGELQELAKILGVQEDPMEEVHKDPARMADMLQSVLDYDARHPAENPPDFTCTTLHRTIRGEAHPVPQEVWATIRHTLRLATEEAIHDMRAAARKKPQQKTPAAPHEAP